MPFVSKAQQRFAFGTHQPWAKEWADKTDFKGLPQHVAKKGGGLKGSKGKGKGGGVRGRGLMQATGSGVQKPARIPMSVGAAAQVKPDRPLRGKRTGGVGGYGYGGGASSGVAAVQGRDQFSPTITRERPLGGGASQGKGAGGIRGPVTGMRAKLVRGRPGKPGLGSTRMTAVQGQIRGTTTRPTRTAKGPRGPRRSLQPRAGGGIGGSASGNQGGQVSTKPRVMAQRQKVKATRGPAIRVGSMSSLQNAGRSQWGSNSVGTAPRVPAAMMGRPGA